MKFLSLLFALFLIAPTAKAEKVKVQIRISNLTATFSTRSQPAVYEFVSSSLECTMRATVNGDTTEQDCSQTNASAEGQVTLVYQPTGKNDETLITIKNISAQGKSTINTFKAKVVEGSMASVPTGGTAVLEIADKETHKLATDLTQKENGVSLNLKMKVKGKSKVTFSGSDAVLVLPEILVEGEARTP